MEAFSSSLFANTIHHPKCLLSSSSYSTVSLRTPKLTTTSHPTALFHISSSLTTQDPKSTKNSSLNIETSLEEKQSTRAATENRQNNKKKAASSSSPLLINTVFNALDDIVNNFIDPPLRPSFDPKHVLSHNFAPVEELPPTDCPLIEGTLPPCLDGAYIRNGPNPQYLPRGPYHLFDGDGMLHSLRISNGRATLCSRYVKTYKYNIERKAGSPVLPNVFSGFNGFPAIIARGALSAARVISGQYNPINGIGLANTSLAFFANKLFALGESDLPYEIRLTPDGDIETIGRYDFEGKLSMSMTAHPKIDVQTGEAFAFRYGPMPPFLTFFRFDQSGTKQPDVPIFSLKTPAFIHDFAVTKNYAIFGDIQIGMTTNPMEIGNGGSVVRSDLGKVPRIGVIPRYAKDESEMKWFDVPGFNIIHAINAWEEEEEDANTIVLIAPNILSVEHTLERMELIHASVERVKIDLKTGTVTRFPISTKNLDFGVINPDYMGRKNRYGYAAVGDPMPKISGVVKLDWSSGGEEVGCRMFGNGCYGGEPFFVSKGDGKEEDEGYVVTYVHDENSGVSKFLVMDAKSPTLDIVAAVKLPRRVPYGFHGLFVKETDLNKL